MTESVPGSTDTSPRSAGSISDWTHPKSLEFLNASKVLHTAHNLNGACVSASYLNPQSRDLVGQWKNCALVKDCIAPSGSNRANHRQDQSILSVLAHQSGLTRRMPTGYYGFKIHQDID